VNNLSNVSILFNKDAFKSHQINLIRSLLSQLICKTNNVMVLFIAGVYFVNATE